MQNNIFWHICGLNNWKSIVLDQHNTIILSNILDKIDKVYISYTGNSVNEISSILGLHPKYQLINYTNKFNDYERPCLHSLLDWSQNNESNVLYIHAKGVSRPNSQNVWKWRKLLEHICITNHTSCIDKLSKYNVVGSNLCYSGTNDKLINETHKTHFSGNFWWSKTSYIKTLPKIRPDFDDLSIDNRYWLCERWVMVYYPDNLFYEIYRSDHVHYYSQSPPNLDNIKLIL